MSTQNISFCGKIKSYIYVAIWSYDLNNVIHTDLQNFLNVIKPFMSMYTVCLGSENECDPISKKQVKLEVS